MDVLTFIVLIIIIIFLIALYVIFFINTANNNPSWRIQQGTSTATSDSMVSGGHNLYITNTTATSFNLTILANNGNIAGRTIAILNKSAAVVTLITNQLIYTDNSVLKPNTYSQFTFTALNNMTREFTAPIFT